MKWMLSWQWTTASFNLPPEGSALKENKLDCFEHKHIFCFKLQCASIVYLLCTALWWKSKDAVVHCHLKKTETVSKAKIEFRICTFPSKLSKKGKFEFHAKTSFRYYKYKFEFCTSKSTTLRQAYWPLKTSFKSNMARRRTTNS